ncbi:Type I Iterative PKS [Alternaria metachromatica]|uniref:Type I Iterative PKS n=1 Tax=Alternaria metachromatica TaxID=283354 RepID=UPI0020C36C78|nr:Type I Iterative PKS [Alternaria metachromatica]KAI4608824.1 Type I Iterative PKS [Alternaria metachromatica]
MEPIAIVGLSYKLPEGDNEDHSFWDNLQRGRSLSRPWPKYRGNIDAFYSSNVAMDNTVYSTNAHFVKEDPAAFDAAFFSITSKEAASMDPQQRWLLETSYKALENAGIPPETLAGSQTAVFAASMSDDYSRILARDPDEAPTNTATGTSPSILANRLSWYFDFKGPSIQLNTACSTSMIAMDLACHSLRSGQSSMVTLPYEIALLAGANVLLSVEISLYLSNMQMLSPDGVSYSFDHRANGYARGEGAVVLVLKRLSDAIRDSDVIRAVVRATGSNQDGRTPGITQPSAESQEQLIRHVYKSCNLGFESTRYVEAHGTGTQLGDATEMKAIGRAFRASRSQKHPLYVGSVKSNIGHLEGCSGLAGILKSIMILEMGVIPPSALFEKISPKINAKIYNVEVPTKCIPWPTNGLRRISVNSFGFGGSNGHVILDDAYHTLESMNLQSFHNTLVPSTLQKPQTNGNTPNGNLNGTNDHDHASEYGVTVDPAHMNGSTTVITTQSVKAPEGSVQLLVWSARDEAALRLVIQQYTDYFDKRVLGHEEKLRRLAYTLSSRRSVMAWKAYAVVDPGEKSTTISAATSTLIRSAREAGMAWIFTGQDEMEHGNNINQPCFSQPLCTALQIALVELLRSFSIAPLAVVGHSSGEIAAAYCIGALSLESACKVAYHRGRQANQLMESLPRPGAMMSVNLPESGVSGYLAKASLSGNIHVACVNSPFNVTLSGDEASIDTLKDRLDEDGIFAQKVRTGVAYHSPAMHDISAEYYSSMGPLERGEQQGSIFMVSSVTGTVVDADALVTGTYWVDNLVSPVRFADALRYLAVTAPKLDRNHTIHDYIEIGPHAALKRPTTETLGQYTTKKQARYMSLLSKFDSSLRSTLMTIGCLFTYGYAPSIDAANLQDAQAERLQILVDLPEYPFDRSQTYWHETRLSRDWRMRNNAPRSVLGICATDWNPSEPRWRKMLSLEETPWLADHVVGDQALFPATGMIMMALEAVKQHFQADQVILGYNIKEATFMNPIVVSSEPNSKTEVVTQLRPLRQDYEKTSTRSEVRIFARPDSEWIECVRAEVHVDYEETATEVDCGLEARAHAKALLDSYVAAEEQCTLPISKTTFYDWHKNQGLKYGEAFALADNIHWDGDELGIASVDVSAPMHFYEGVVHPAVLDAACQVCFTAPSTGMSDKLPTIIPHKVYDTWISASGWQHPQTRHIRMLTTSRFKRTIKGIESSFTALADDGSPLCHVSRLEMSPVLGAETKSEVERKLLHGFDWKPQLSLMKPSQLQVYCEADYLADDESMHVKFILELEQTIRTVVHRNLDRLEDTDWSTAPTHMKKYLSWLKLHLEHVPILSQAELADEELNDKLYHLSTQFPDWRMFIEIAEHIVPIVRGDINALELLFSTTLAQDIYKAMFAPVYNDKFISYLSLVAHENPTQKILEVGSGTGAMTDHIISTLRDVETRTGGTAFSSYTYTDVSPGFFEKAREKFSHIQDRMVFKTFDIESDVTKQGFQSGTYDVILAGSVIHATKNLALTLQNLRRALKPGGKLIFHETTAPDCFLMNFGFGILPGWWLSEEKFRTSGPTITEPEWDRLLRENGFSGNDFVIRDYEEPAAHQCSVIFSTADEDLQPTQRSGRILFVVNDANQSHYGLGTQLLQQKPSTFRTTTRICLFTQVGVAEVSKEDIVVFLADISGDILMSTSAEALQLIREWVHASENLLWVSSAVLPNNTDCSPYPCASLKDGFLRAMRLEFANKRIVTLSIEDAVRDWISGCDAIWDVLDVMSSAQSPELEYVLRDGHMLTGRLVEEKDLNVDLNSLVKPQMRTEPWLPGPPLKIEIGSRGSLETLHFAEDTEHHAPLGDREVEIEAKAWGLNFRDMFQALGRLEEDTFGSDCAGIVTRVGFACTQFKPGDRVCICGVGCMRMLPRADEWATVAIPEAVSFEEACAVLNCGITAYYSLAEVARLQKGEKILIHAASGATGQLAIQIAKLIGAEIFVTVGFDFKKQHLIDLYGIPSDHIFYSRNTTFAKGIMRLTNGYGVDVVLNSLVGEGLRASWECVAPYGRFVEIGKADINANSSLPMAAFANNVSFFAVDLRHIALNRKQMGRDLLHKTMDLVGEGNIHCPRPLNLFPVSDVEGAFRYLQSGKNTGRIIIQIDPSAKVQNASYVVAGGLGGIGRSILRWVASRGARHLIVPSRSGTASGAAVELVSELAELGINVCTPKCDASNAESLSDLLAACAKSMPPIRGCINATMMLNDATFDNMSHTQWVQTIRSKAHTSWNLHTVLPRDLDFFIMLSSVAGVAGNIGQSNYAAGCTFQDALARHRVQHQQRATSIDLGVMRTIGIVAETERLHENFKKSGSLGQIEEDEFLAVLTIYCDPEHTKMPMTIDKSQIAMGLVTPVDLIERNLEPAEVLQRPLFASFSQARGTNQSNTQSSVSAATLFNLAEDDEQRVAVVLEALARKLARALSIPPEEIDVNKPLHAFGVDSLVAVELRNWIGKEFAADIAVFDIMRGRTVAAIGELITKMSQLKRTKKTVASLEADA